MIGLPIVIFSCTPQETCAQHAWIVFACVLKLPVVVVPPSKILSGDLFRHVAWTIVESPLKSLRNPVLVKPFDATCPTQMAKCMQALWQPAWLGDLARNGILTNMLFVITKSQERVHGQVWVMI